jgi:hypothetical protein
MNALIPIGGKASPKSFADIANNLFPKYYKHIKDNHGIRERNVLELLAPLGVPVDVFGPTLLPNLDSLGERRGMHAHQSAKAVQTALDPETEYVRIASLTKELLVLDEWLSKYRKRIK